MTRARCPGLARLLQLTVKRSLIVRSLGCMVSASGRRRVTQGTLRPCFLFDIVGTTADCVCRHVCTTMRHVSKRHIVLTALLLTLVAMADATNAEERGGQEEKQCKQDASRKHSTCFENQLLILTFSFISESYASTTLFIPALYRFGVPSRRYDTSEHPPVGILSFTLNPLQAASTWPDHPSKDIRALECTLRETSREDTPFFRGLRGPPMARRSP